MTLTPEQRDALGKFTPPFEYDSNFGVVIDSNAAPICFPESTRGNMDIIGTLIAALLNQAAERVKEKG